MTTSPDSAAIAEPRPELPFLKVSTGLQVGVEQFLYYEARLLDQWLWTQWLGLFDEDIRYWMPLRKNRLRVRSYDGEYPKGIQIAHMDEDLQTLTARVKQLESSTHWSEDPPSRTRHIVTNVYVEGIEEPAGGPAELSVRSYFLLYRNRASTEVDIWSGHREDVLRVGGDAGFKIARRTVLMDQNVLLAKNLSIPF